ELKDAVRGFLLRGRFDAEKYQAHFAVEMNVVGRHGVPPRLVTPTAGARRARQPAVRATPSKRLFLGGPPAPCGGTQRSAGPRAPPVSVPSPRPWLGSYEGPSTAFRHRRWRKPSLVPPGFVKLAKLLTFMLL